jgi:DNA-binding beta-propeller fold protein YncE
MPRGARKWLRVLVPLGIALGVAVAVTAPWRSASPIVGSAPVGQFPQDMVVDAQRGRAFVYSSGGLQLPATAQRFGPATLSTIDMRTGARLSIASIGVNPSGIAEDQRTGRVFVVSENGAPVCSSPGPAGCELPNTTFVSVFDAATGQQVRSLSVFAPAAAQGGSLMMSGPGAIAVDADAGHAFVVSRTTFDAQGDAGVAMLDGTTGLVLRRVTLRPGPLAVAIDSNAHRAYVTNLGGYAPTSARGASLGGMLWILDTRSGALLRAVHLGALPVDPVAADDRARHVFALAGSLLGGARMGAGHVLMLDPRSGTLIKAITLGPASLFSLTVDGGSGRVFVSTISVDGRAGAVVEIDGRSGAPMRTIPLTGVPVAMAIAPQREQLLVSILDPGGDASRVLAIDIRNGRTVDEIDMGKEASALAFDARSGHVLIAGSGGPQPPVDRLTQAMNAVRAFFGHPAPTPQPDGATSQVTTLNPGG